MRDRRRRAGRERRLPDLGSMETDTVWRFRASTPLAILLYPVSVGNDITSLRGLAIDLNRSVLVSNQGAEEDPAPRPDQRRADRGRPGRSPSPTSRASRSTRSPRRPPSTRTATASWRTTTTVPRPRTPTSWIPTSTGWATPATTTTTATASSTSPTTAACSRRRTRPTPKGRIREPLRRRLRRRRPVDPGDGIVGALDFTRFRDAYVTSTGNPGYYRDIDANSDGAIGALDFAVFESSLPAPAGAVGARLRRPDPLHGPALD